MYSKIYFVSMMCVLLAQYQHLVGKETLNAHLFSGEVVNLTLCVQTNIDGDFFTLTCNLIVV